MIHPQQKYLNKKKKTKKKKQQLASQRLTFHGLILYYDNCTFFYVRTQLVSGYL